MKNRNGFETEDDVMLYIGNNRLFTSSLWWSIPCFKMEDEEEKECRTLAQFQLPQRVYCWLPALSWTDQLERKGEIKETDLVRIVSLDYPLID